LVIIRLAQKNQKRCSACLKSIHEVTGAITITYQQRRASRLSIISARYYWRKYGRDLSRSADYNNKRNAFYRLSFKQARWVAGFDLGSVEFTTFKKRILRTFIKTPPSGLNANLTKGCSLQDSGMEYYWRASSRQLDAIIQSTSRLRATASTTTATTTNNSNIRDDNMCSLLWTKIVIPRCSSVISMCWSKKIFGQIESSIESRSVRSCRNQSRVLRKSAVPSISTTLSSTMVPLCPPSHSLLLMFKHGNSLGISLLNKCKLNYEGPLWL
jgi:hypothetical protein